VNAGAVKKPEHGYAGQDLLPCRYSVATLHLGYRSSRPEPNSQRVEEKGAAMPTLGTREAAEVMRTERPEETLSLET